MELNGNLRSIENKINLNVIEKLCNRFKNVNLNNFCERLCYRPRSNETCLRKEDWVKRLRKKMTSSKTLASHSWRRSLVKCPTHFFFLRQCGKKKSLIDSKEFRLLLNSPLHFAFSFSPARSGTRNLKWFFAFFTQDDSSGMIKCFIICHKNLKAICINFCSSLLCCSLSFLHRLQMNIYKIISNEHCNFVTSRGWATLYGKMLSTRKASRNVTIQ